MTFHWAEWGPPLVVMAVGLLAGLVYARITRGSDREHAEAAVAGRREDLRKQKEGTLEALRALELERDKLDPEDYAAQRRALVARGADALRGLDAGAAVEAAEAADSADAGEPAEDVRAMLERQRATLGDAAVDAALAALEGQATVRAESPPVSPAWQGAAWALLAVAVGAILWWNLGGTATERGGGSITGNQPTMGPGPAPRGPSAAPQTTWPGQAELEARLEQDPNDLETLNGLTEIALGQEDLGAAMSYNTRALQIAPEDHDARVYFALLRMSIGQVDKAMADLEAVLAEAPGHARALAYKGLILLNEGRAEEAASALEQAIAAGAPGRAALEQELARAKAMAAGEIPAPNPTPLSPDATGAMPNHPPMGPAPAPASASGGAVLVSGTITLDAAVAGRLSGSEQLFVSLRDPAGGPPLAALKLPAGPFPMSFRVTDANVLSMGSGARVVPDTFDLTVRIDTDGNAMTRSDAEPSFTQQGVAKGTSELQAALR